MLRSTLSAVTVAILTALMPAQVAAENLDGVKVSVKVEEFCGLTATGLEMSVGQQVLQTTVQETCNRASGFHVIAGHRSLLAGEQVQIEYAGTVSDLDESGMSNVVFRPGPRIGSVPVILRARGLRENLLVNLTLSSF